jgi:nucleoside phosphorylase
MFEAALAEERHRRPEDPLARDRLPMSLLRPDAPPLVVVFHALSIEAARVRAHGWRVLHRDAAALEAPREPTLTWIRTGMGPEAARRTVLALPPLAIDAALLLGFAGGLAPGMAPGTLVVGDPLLDETGHAVPTPLSKVLAETARAAGIASVRGALLTVGRVVETPTEKSRLHRAHDALAVDMESAILATVLSERGIPAAAARVVLDTAEESVPASFGAVLRHPAQIATGLRIASRLRRCSAISARLLEAWLDRTARGPEAHRPADGGHDAEAEESHGR